MKKTLTLAMALLGVFTDASGADWNRASHVPLDSIYATGQVVLRFEGCPGRLTRACAIGVDPVQIFIPPAQYRPEALAGVYYHELGHAFDRLILTDGERKLLMSVMGHVDHGWVSPPNSPHEQFAEAFRLCALHGLRWKGKGDFTTKYGWRPRPATQRRTCRLIRQLAIRARADAL